MRTVLISIDHKWRDLPDRVRLGWLLEEKGHRVFFTRQGFEYPAACAIRPDAVVYNHVYHRDRQSQATRLKSHGVANVVLPTEGMGMIEGTRRLIAGGFACYDMIDLMLMWNEESRRLALEIGSIDASRVAVVGAPRFDFYAPPLDSLLMPRGEFCRKYGLDGEKPTLTVATNFTQAHKSVEYFAADAKSMNLDRALPFYKDIPSMDLASRGHMERSLERLVGELKDINLVLRPHPSEEHVFYSALVDRLRARAPRCRIALPVMEYFWDIMVNSDVLVQRSCVTGYEAWFRGLPTLEFRLNPAEWYVSEDHTRGCDVVTSEDQFVERVRHSLENGAVSPERREVQRPLLHRWFGPLDGRALARSAEAIHALVEGRPAARLPYSGHVLWTRLKYAVKSAGDFALSDFKNYGFRTADREGRFDRYVHFRDIEVWRERLAALRSSPAAVPSRV